MLLLYGTAGQVIYCYIRRNRGITRTITIRIEIEMCYEIDFAFLRVTACQKFHIIAYVKSAMVKKKIGILFNF